MGKSLFDALLCTSHIASWPAGAVHAAIAALGLVSLPHVIVLSHGARFSVLRRCWFAKGMRELLPFVLEGPARAAAMQRVRFEPPIPSGTGCVLATLRSPWIKLLSERCRELHAGRVLVRGGRSRQWREAAIAADREGLRSMIAHLRQGGRLFVAMEAFADGNGCPVHFLGERRQASLLPARLAQAANVPLMAAFPVERAGYIEFDYGPRASVHGRDDLVAATTAVMGYLERCVLDDPASWNESLRGWIGLRRGSEPRREEAAVDADRLAGDESGRG